MAEFLLSFFGQRLPSFPDFDKITLKNGLTFIVQKDSSIPYFSIQVFFREGYGVENRSNCGLHRLWLAWMMRGPKGMSFLDFTYKIETLGGKYSWDVEPDYSVVSIEGPSKNFEELTSLLIDTLEKPNFSHEDFRKVKKSLIAKRKREKESPFDLTYNTLLKNAYGETGYGVDPFGEISFFENVTENEIKTFHAEFFGAQNIVVSAVGDISWRRLEILKKKLSKIKHAPRKSSKPICRYRVIEKVIKNDLPQSMVMLAVKAPEVRKKKQYIATKLINAFTGKGMSSLLFVEAREKRSLGYEVTSFFPTRKCGSLFVWYIKTSPGKTQKALSLFRKLLKSLPEVLSEEKLKKSATKEAGTFLLSHQSFSRRAWYLGWYEIIGAGAEFDLEYPEMLEKIKTEEILSTAKFLSQQKPSIVILNP